ncbi:MAG: hypothetical protein MUE97_00815 [Phycisphaerales bacterium]|nr:hypothetical protein [Phycisphaerales bacterium]
MTRISSSLNLLAASRVLLVCWCALLGMVGGVVGGCDLSPQARVMTAYQKGEKAIETFRAAEFMATCCDKTPAYFSETIRLAREAKSEELRGVHPALMASAIALRNRAPGHVLKRMDVDEYVVWMIDNGLLIVDAQHGIYPYKIVVAKDGQSALMEIGYDLRHEDKVTPRTTSIRRGLGGAASAAVSSMFDGMTQVVPIEDAAYRFILQGDRWVHDWDTSQRNIGRWMAREARDMDMKIWEVVIAQEEAEHGSVKKDIWTPPFPAKR